MRRTTQTKLGAGLILPDKEEKEMKLKTYANAVRKRLVGGAKWNALFYAKKHGYENDPVWDSYYHFVKFSYFHNRLKYKSSPFFDSEQEIFDIYGLKIPRVEPEDAGAFWFEYADLILPYKNELDGHRFEFDRISPLMDEGPYELNDDISIHENDVVIDCGANIGLFSAIASRKGAVSYAFEPSERIRKKYTDATAKANGNIIVCPYALGSEKGTAYFDDDSAVMSAGRLSGSGDNKGEEVQITTIDSFVAENNIARVDFIKADIEGAEREMLKGAGETLKKFAPKLSICTYHLPDDKEVLESLIREANPKYNITHAYKKLYACVQKT